MAESVVLFITILRCILENSKSKSKRKGIRGIQ